MLAKTFVCDEQAADHTCGYRRGNKVSKAVKGNFSDTGPLSVSEASRPREISSARRRRAVRSGSPMMRTASPGSNSPAPLLEERLLLSHAGFPLHVSGPFGSDGPDWSSKFQLYAAAGYAVVYANYRGSTSYGAGFSEPANHNFPGLAYDDMMSITDEAIRRGFADPNRLFITGGSAGGELTAWITGKTNRFRAAVAEKPVINLLSDALTTDQYLASPIFDEGDPWTREKELWAHSPLSLADAMKTPTLLIVGEEDYRTPLDQALQLYDVLQLQGVPTALMRVPGAGHENLSSRPSQFAAEIAATLAWFHQYDLSPTH